MGLWLAPFLMGSTRAMLVKDFSYGPWLLPREGGRGVMFREGAGEDPRRPRDTMEALLLGVGLQWERARRL